MVSDDRSSRVALKPGVAVVSVSDVTAGWEAPPGSAVEEALVYSGHAITRRASVKRDHNEVQRALREAIEDPEVQVIVIVGGTGLAKDDITLEAVESFEEKPLPGFGEALRRLPEAGTGPESCLLRGAAFVSEGKLVFCLPGSDDLARSAAEHLIGPVLEGAVKEANR